MENSEMAKKNILFTICGRAGSKGVKGKNVALFCGEPIVYYTLNAYEKYNEKYKDIYNIDLAVNTDSSQLIQQIEKRKKTRFYRVERKEDLSGDIVAKGEVIRDTMTEMERLTAKTYDLVVDLDITSPLRNVSDIAGVVDLVLEHDQCNFSYSVVESRRNPYFNMVIQQDDGYYKTVIPSKYTSRQMTPRVYDMNASIYAYAREYLLDMTDENRHALVWVMEDTAILDIDSENDMEMMQVLAKYYWGKGKYQDIL
jgi:CMP-N,N'-diacetyllegionaminic acid synthase